MALSFAFLHCMLFPLTLFLDHKLVQAHSVLPHPQRSHCRHLYTCGVTGSPGLSGKLYRALAVGLFPEHWTD